MCGVCVSLSLDNEDEEEEGSNSTLGDSSYDSAVGLPDCMCGENDTTVFSSKLSNAVANSMLPPGGFRPLSKSMLP